METRGINKYHLRLYFRLRMKETVKKLEELEDDNRLYLRFSLESRILDILEDVDFFKRIHGLTIFTPEEINYYHNLLLEIK